MLLVVGEALVEIMRPRVDLPLDRAGPFLGPYPSGAPAIFASVAARLGARTKLCAAVGNDPFGRMLRARLARDGVGIERVAVRAGRVTGVAFVSYSSDGARTFVFHVGDSAAATLTPEDLDDLPERAAWLHVSGSALTLAQPLAETAMQALERARASGATIGFDPNFRPEACSAEALDRLRHVASVADFLFPSEGELEALGIDPDAPLKRGATVCTTFGEHGVVVAAQDNSLEVRSPQADEVDPTGAGDHFAAGFTASLMRGLGIAEAAAAGCRVAARCVESFGPMEASLESVAREPLA